jgi:hypothetical protein
MTREDLIIPGINIQAPWSGLILSGRKTVETRSYPLPDRHKGKRLAIIETPGKDKSAGKAKIIGIVVFSHSFRYEYRKQWFDDIGRHLVKPNDSMYKFESNKPKYGWVVKSVVSLKAVVPPPKKRGIIFASECVLPGQFLPT